MTSPNEEQERRWRIFHARRKHYLGTPADLADIPASDLMTVRQRLHAAAQQGDQEAWTYAVLADAEMHRRDARSRRHMTTDLLTVQRNVA